MRRCQPTRPAPQPRSQTTLPEYQQKQAQIAEAQALLSTKFGADAKWALLMPGIALANMTVFISQFSAVSTVAGEGLPSMSTGGLAWFPDLTLPDPFYGLPVLCAALTLAMVESGALSAEMGQAQTARTLKWVMRVFALVFVPAGGYVPAAVGVLWFSNSLFSLAQAGILRSPRLRRALGLPSLEAVRAAAAAASEGPPSPLTAKLQQLMGSGAGDGGGAGSGGGSSAAGAAAAAAAAAGASSGGGGSGGGSAVPPPPGTRPSRLVMQKPAGWKRRKS
jgi:YidC/Oxa1 family membrane protein insertase